MKLYSVIIFLIWSSPAFSNDDLPNGWRYATDRELDESYIKWREESASKYTRVDGDFNGDGVADIALLLKSTAHNGQGLLIKLSNKISHHKWVVADEIEWPKKYKNVGLSMGISLSKPGVHPINCESYEENPNKKCSLEIKFDSISYFRFASSGSIIYWDDSKDEFERVWQGQ